MKDIIINLHLLLLSCVFIGFCSCSNDEIEDVSMPNSVNASQVNSDYEQLLKAVNAGSKENISYKDKVIVEVGRNKKKISGDGEVSIRYSVIPLYVHKSETKSSGEYYIVDATISISSAGMYDSKNSVRFDKDSKTYYYRGLYLKGFDIDASLERSDGSKERITFDKTPMPQTDVNLTTYTSGVTWGINGTLSGGEKGLGGTVEANFSFTNTKSHTVRDLEETNNSEMSSGLVRYSLELNNLPKRANDEPPLISRTTLDFHFSWIWYLPDAKANDETTKYKMKINIKNLIYEGIGNSQRKVTEKMPDISKEFELPVTNRILSGSVLLENDSEEELMTDIKYTNIATSKVYADDTQSAYGKDMGYRKELPIGKYWLSYKLGGKECKSDKPIEIETAKNIKIYSGYFE